MRIKKCVWETSDGKIAVRADGKNFISDMNLCGTVTDTGTEASGTGPFGYYIQKKLTGNMPAGSTGDADATWTLYTYPSGALGLGLSLANKTSHPVTLGMIRLLSLGGEGGMPLLGSEPAEWRVFTDPGKGDCSSRGITENAGVHVSCGLCVLWSPLTGISFAVGQAEIEKTLTHIRVGFGQTSNGVYCWSDAVSPVIEVTQDAEGYELEPGETFACDLFMLTVADDPFRALEAMADQVKIYNRIRSYDSRDIAVGCMDTMRSSERTVSEQAEQIHKLGLHDYGFRDIILDDGYQMEIRPGDRLESEKYAQKLRALDIRPGIWLTPFIVTEDSAVFREHPDWCADYGDGKPRPAFDWCRCDTPVYAYELDPTKPGAMEWVENVFRTFYQRGYRFFKCELSGGLLHTGSKKFYNRKMTGLMRWRWAWRRIREATGSDAILQICSSDNISCAGIADSVGTGSDIKKSVPAPLRDVRWWQNGRYFITDTGPMAVNKNLYNGVADMRHKLSLGMREARVRTVMLFAAGGNIILGDRLEEEEKINMIKKLLPVCGQPARPVDMFRRTVPYILHHSFSHERSSWDVVSVVNYGDSALAEAIPLDTLGLDASRQYFLYEFWSGKVLNSIKNGALYASVPPHDVRTYRLTVLKTGISQLIGSTFHLSMGLLEIASMTHANKGLRVTVVRPRTEKGVCHFYHAGTTTAVEITAGPEGTEIRI